MSIESSTSNECSSSSMSNCEDDIEIVKVRDLLMAKKAGFDVRRGGEYKAVGFGDATTKYFHCTREGFLLNPKEKSGVKSLDVDISKHSKVSDGFERFRDPKKKQTIRKPTFRCGCLASLTIKRIGNVFEVNETNPWGFYMVGVTVNDCKNKKKKISVFIGNRDA
ncbi:FAR1 DNA binding domain, zinc finger, SWIM-type, MULE transposase domain containing protein [Tanacetum coccineum]